MLSDDKVRQVCWYCIQDPSSVVACCVFNFIKFPGTSFGEPGRAPVACVQTHVSEAILVGVI